MTTLKILCIDDDPDILAVIKMSLEVVGGHVVTACANEQEALEALKLVTPDIILLDVMLPNTDGPSIIRALRALPQLCATPMVFMTARTSQSEMSRYISYGAAAVFTKPFEPMKLAGQVQKIWEQARAKE